MAAWGDAASRSRQVALTHIAGSLADTGMAPDGLLKDGLAVPGVVPFACLRPPSIAPPCAA